MVLELTDRFALENHDPKLGDTISDNLCENTNLFYISPFYVTCLLDITAVEVDNSSNELIEMFSSVQNSSIKLNSSIFMGINVTGMLHINNLMIHIMIILLLNRPCWWGVLY